MAALKEMAEFYLALVVLSFVGIHSASASTFCVNASYYVRDADLESKQPGKSLAGTDLAGDIRTSCNPGDLIAIPSDLFDVIGKICDFSKQIAVTPYGSNSIDVSFTFCTVSKQKDVR